MKLQACTKCGAQFDVSTFTPGQQFTCGACGEVLSAHEEAKPASVAPAAPVAKRTPGSGAAPSRTPGSAPAPASRRSGGAPSSPKRRGGAPRRGGRTPGGSQRAVVGGPAAPSRGPQYQPVQRAGQEPSGPSRTKAPASRRPATGEEGEGPAGRRGAPRRGAAGPNKGLLIGAGVVVVIVVGMLAALGGSGSNDTGGDDDASMAGGDNGTGDTDPGKVAKAEPTETVRDIMGEYGVDRPTTLRQYRGFIRRLREHDPEKIKIPLGTVYKAFIEGPGRDDREARAFLGYKEFAHEIPEDITFRKYDYLEAVQQAYYKRWYGPDEKPEYDLAMAAWKETEDHREKLINDHRFRAADAMRGNISREAFFKDYNYAARWADPYLICYSSTDRLSEYDLLSIADKDERRAKMEDLRKKREAFTKVLDEKAAIYQQLYKEFMKRYEKSLGLVDLMAAFGGKPDYPIGVRSYQDGVTLVIWIFDSRKAFDEYHAKVKQEMIPHNVAGYFSPRTARVYLYDEGDRTSNRVFEINKNVHEGVHQLEYWFTRQRNRWRHPKPGQDWFKEGISELIGAVQMQPDRTLNFISINVPRLKNMQNLAKTMKAQGNEYQLFPVNKLVAFSSYAEVQGWGAGNWGLSGGLVLSMFYQQSWAFVYFLNNYKDGRYRKQFEEFFNLRLHREAGGNTRDQAFREAFRIRDEDDWEDLNEEFHEYIKEELMKLNASKFDYTPPARGETTGK